jgi:hypothetical protein
VLTPGGAFIASYSNRCFPTKAVAIWRSLGLREQASLIGLYMKRSGFSDIAAEILSDGSRGDPMIVVTGRA